MNKAVFKPIEKLPELLRVRDALASHSTPVAVFGLTDSQRCHFFAALESPRPILYIAANDLKCRRIADELSTLNDSDGRIFHEDDSILFSRDSGSRDIDALRISVLNTLRTPFDGDGHRPIVVTTAGALLRPLVKPEIFDRSLRLVRQGDTLDLDELTAFLVMAGYERVPTAESHGQFSIRGGIVDIVCPGGQNGIRIELFGDDVDSLREYDPESQRSTESVESYCITPAREMILTDEMTQTLASQLRSAAKRFFENYNGEDGEQKRRRFEALSECMPEKSMLPFANTETCFLTDYFAEPPLVIIDEPKAVSEQASGVLGNFQQTLTSMLERGEALPKYEKNLASADSLYADLRTLDILMFQAFSGKTDGFNPKTVCRIGARNSSPFYGNIDALAEEVSRLTENGGRVLLQLGTQPKAERIAEELRDRNCNSAPLESLGDEWQGGLVCTCAGGLERGFVYTDIGYAVITEQDIFVQKQVSRRPKHRNVAGASPIRNWSDLTVGDIVVHDSHGVGIFRGVKVIEAGGVKRDYLQIDYSGADKLYVPAEQMDCLQKYIGMEENAPRLNKLGGNEWNATKARVRKSVEDLTDQLSTLYAQRAVTKGHSFAPDSPWQLQFEADFPYQETDDQLAAVSEIKRDMESERVMDRLLCGDVGYGKTEVALRAAFKAVLDNKQVAILAPTTILVQQHYNTLLERFSGYPVKCEMISRFRTPTEKQRILQSLEYGGIDIIVGTHALLAKNIRYKDLGLLIIDEEQRFGVKHKERIKELKKSVDVLTMTATPIPRTLHMSLTGIRDMSLIEEAPHNRCPVQTFCLDYSESLVRDAVLRELNRGGQVFYVVNRVIGIEAVYKKLAALVPEASICVAHGQMSAVELENTMLDFYNGKYNLLICTTIIENGIDVPLANTLIVQDADMFGLSQLYQMRGRVGRSDRVAYAYFMVQANKAMSETAHKRLEAIRDFTDLGAGFKIAMRDLEIRGAGNLMGSAQHGHMSAVGYEMYCRLIEEAVNKLKGNAEAPPDIQTNIDIQLNAHIPEAFIRAEKSRIGAYKRIATVTDDESRSDVIDELTDRYGDVPDEVINLINIAYLKNLASKAGLSAISQKDNRLVCTFHASAKPPLESFTRLLFDNPDTLTLRATDPPVLVITYRPNTARPAKTAPDNTAKQLLAMAVGFFKEL